MNLFDMSPEALQQQRAAALDTAAQNYARQDAQQRADAAGYQFGNVLGRSIGSALGVEDKELMKVRDIQGMVKGIDVNDPEALLSLSKQLGNKGYMAEGEMAWKKAQEILASNASINKDKATAAKVKAEQDKIELSTQQEAKLREELSRLGPDATEEDFLKVVRKYGKPDEVMKSIETRMQKEAALEEKKRAAEAALAAKLEEARMRGETAKEIARMQIEGRKEIASLVASLKQSSKGDKTLPASLQKSEDEDLNVVNSLGAQAAAITPSLKALETSKLELGPVNNSLYAAANASGKSNEQSRAYAELQRAVQSAVNLKVSAEKGVQTDKDVLRFANELTAAFGGNDTKATIEALKNFKAAIEKAKENKKSIIQSRRKSQGVGAYEFEDTPEPSKEPTTPVKRIKFDAQGNIVK